MLIKKRVGNETVDVDGTFSVFKKRYNGKLVFTLSVEGQEYFMVMSPENESVMLKVMRATMEEFKNNNRYSNFYQELAKHVIDK